MEFKSSLREFEEASGIIITEYGGGHIGESVDALMSLRGKWGPIQQFTKSTERAIERVQTLHKEAVALESLARDAGLEEIEEEDDA